RGENRARRHGRCNRKPASCLVRGASRFSRSSRVQGDITMPSGKKGGQGQGRDNGGMRQEGWQVGQQIREGAEQVSDRVREGIDTAREGIGRGYRRAEGTIARNPAPSVLIGFGVGFGLGVALVSLF